MSRRKKGHEEDHGVGHADERWLITYADMITLLMVLFIVLFAMSKVDQAKYISLASGLAGSFSETRPNIIPGGGGLASPSVPGPPHFSLANEVGTLVAPPLGKESSGSKNTPTPPVSPANKPGTDVAVVARQAVLNDKNDLSEARLKIGLALKAAGIKKGVIMAQDDMGLTVTVVNDLVFDADRADVLPAGQRLLRIIAPALVEIGHKVGGRPAHAGQVHQCGLALFDQVLGGGGRGLGDLGARSNAAGTE